MFAKTYSNMTHEYIVRNKCALTNIQFVEFIDAQQKFG